MRYCQPKFFSGILVLGLLFSCAAMPPAGLPPGGTAEGSPVPEAPAERPAENPPGGSGAAKPPARPSPGTRPEQLSRPGRVRPAAVLERPPERPPEEPVISPVPEKILGEGRKDPAVLAAFLRYSNPEAGEFAADLAKLYVEEAAVEGVNHDVAFAQMCLETGFLRFGGLVRPEMNNFCGLGSIGPGQPGEWFPSSRIGVRAHIQHLKVYATGEPLKYELVDPRYRYVRPGSSPSIQGLAGTWAADRQYAEKITGILERLYTFSPGP